MMFNHHFVENLPLNVPVKELRKSISNWRRYRKEFSVSFYESRCSFLSVLDVTMCVVYESLFVRQ